MIPGFCFDIDGDYWNGHGPGSGCRHCDPVEILADRLRDNTRRWMRRHNALEPEMIYGWGTSGLFSLIKNTQRL